MATTKGRAAHEELDENANWPWIQELCVVMGKILIFFQKKKNLKNLIQD